jgi:hypothetical protein
MQCNNCGVVLKVPDRALGKRLKCPHCGMRISLGTGSAASSFLLSSVDVPGSPADREARPPSSAEALPTRPPSSAEALPTTSSNVPDRFEVPLLDEVGAAPAGRNAVRPGAGRGKAGGGARPAGDALALFEDNPRANRRVGAAEARSKARRCSSCGGVVPAGMSLCSTCGLDQETKTRAALDDDLAPPPQPRGPMPPLPVYILGGIALLGSIVFLVASFALWRRGHDGYQYFIPICAFAIFAAVQFLRLKAIRPLIVALSFGLAIDVVSLIAMPIYNANTETTVVERSVPSEVPDLAQVSIPSVVDRLDTRTLSVGISLVLVYAGVCVYLLSPQLRRHFR